MDNVSLLAAFVAGLLSFVSPCVLPLIPGYLSFVSGVTLDEMRGRHGRRGRRAGCRQRASQGPRPRRSPSSIGFSLVFVSLGASATPSASSCSQHLVAARQDRGRGHHRVRPAHDGRAADRLAVQREARADDEAAGQRAGRPAGRRRVRVRLDAVHRPDPGSHPGRRRRPGIGRAGRAAARGLLARPRHPVLATSLAINRFFAAFARIRRHYRAIEIASGALLVVIGVLILTNRSRSSPSI